MLIKALCDYDDMISASDNNDDKVPEGYTAQKVHFEILLTPDGQIADIVDIRKSIEIPQKNGKSKFKLKPRIINLPLRTEKTSIDKNTIEHRPLYIFGLNYANGTFTTEDKTDKAKKSHQCFCEWNSEFFSDIDSDICKAYLKFIENWNPENEIENSQLMKLGKDYSPNTYFCFGLNGNPDIRLDEDEQFNNKYRAYYQSLREENVASSKDCVTCGILGEKLPPARIHNKIKGVAGGNSTGCVLVGMKETAYESYGKTQSYNSNVSQKAMEKYTRSLNLLIADKTHHQVFDGVTVIYFAIKNNDTAECEFFSNIFSQADNASETNKNLDGLFKEAKGGKVGDLSDFGVDSDVTFYVAGLTANSSRICQKFIVRNKFGTIINNLVQHQLDMKVSENGRQVYLSSIKKQLISPKSSKEEVPPPLITAIISAMLDGTQYPNALLSTVVKRIKLDSDEDKNHFIKFNDTRIGIIKACLNRKARLKGQKEEITMALNTENHNQAYLCGRLFAVLEKIQQDSAGGTLNKTIKDSFFSSACSKPFTVFPRLIQLSQYHLKKLSQGSIVYYNKLVGEIIDEINDEFPSTLSLDDQGRFEIGYYQQNKVLYTKTEKATEEAEETIKE